MRIDHIAIVVDSPAEAADWYVNNHGAVALYSDETWAMVQFDNIKLAFVVSHQHPAHFAFEVDTLHNEKKVKKHRDNTESVYKKDPWGNIYELILYPKNGNQSDI